ncbi:hypothetical protein [Candidatus Magnetaquicoccus inordinatus]|uniref:hypothetical protein n=1 Tax=Candidatus Magnetaquicoccus inordinatus TaxID=2496818 RepID=UPI00102B8B82|nr:hypothetical protein [Candidatus Magnetaquicoccus inordinatus]
MAVQDDLTDSGLRLFLSVDIAGSTKFKASLPSITMTVANNDSRGTDTNDAVSKSWVKVYIEFFSDFPIQFEIAIREARIKVARNISDDLQDQIKLWKMLGDELIFVTNIKKVNDAVTTLLAFHKTIIKYQKLLQEKHNILSLKGTAWTAGFPIRNRRVVNDLPNDQQIEDFIGPDMDIGFRLSKLARSGPIVASMDLVDLLVRHENQSFFNCHFVGWEPMKGVFADKPYPIHWLVEKFKDRELPSWEKELPPWEGAICRFTAYYLQHRNNQEHSDQLIDRINKTRASLNQSDRLGLFEPYLDKSTMPAQHKEIHDLLERNERSEFSKAEDFGVDEEQQGNTTNE